MMPESLYRITLDATTLLQEFPLRLQHPHKVALLEMAYPNHSPAVAEIEVTQWKGHTPVEVVLQNLLPISVIPNFYDYQPIHDNKDAVEWHVNFADPRLFVAYGSGLFAQDEIQVAEHPLLGSVREALLCKGLAPKTCDESGATPILIRNVEHRLSIDTHPNLAAGRILGIYGNRFATTPIKQVQQAVQKLDQPMFNNFIAIAAPNGGVGKYTERVITDIFTTAFTGFAAAVYESGADHPTVIHTGFWGCGAFGGDRQLMVVLQILAAQAAGVDQLVLHTGNNAGAMEAKTSIDVATNLALSCGSLTTTSAIVNQAFLLNRYWGASDGN
jgi:hypothetical protein